MKNNTNLLISAVFLLAAANCFGQPSISIQPANQTANQGFNATFRTTGSGAPPLSYQWFFASNMIVGAITNVLTITNAQPTNAGGYFAVLSNASGSSTSRVATLTVILPVPLDPKLSANIRLGDDPATLPASRRAQTETHLARSWVNPNLLIATCMEGASSDAALDCSYSVSTDGGAAWSARAFIPNLSALSGGTAPRAADVVTAIDASGSLFATTLNVEGDRSIDLFISKSSNSGQSFGPPRSLFRADARYWADKEWIAINTFPDSPTANRIAVVFTRVGGSNQVHYTYSDDGGETWSQIKALGSRDATYAQPFFFRDGSLSVLYEKNLTGYLTEPVRLEYESVRSVDGVTFEPPVLALDLRGSEYADPIAFAWSDFSACTDRQAGVMYLTVPAWFGPATNRIPRILFTKSIDRGRTWTKAVAVNDTPAGKTVFQSIIAASPDGQHVMITFYDRRHDTGQGYLVDFYLAESFDGGDTWEPNIRLSEFSSDLRRAPTQGSLYWIGDYQGLVPALNFDTPAVAAWIDTRAGNNDPYVVRINRTKGTTFDTWRKLRFSTNDLANAAISGEQADPDGDRIPNLAEYAFGFAPTHSDPHVLRAFRSGPSASFRISYERLAVLSDILFEWQTSTNLVDWTPATPLVELLGPGREPSMQRVEVGFAGSCNLCFFRLSLSLKPIP